MLTNKLGFEIKDFDRLDFGTKLPRNLIDKLGRDKNNKTFSCLHLGRKVQYLINPVLGREETCA